MARFVYHVYFKDAGSPSEHETLFMEASTEAEIDPDTGEDALKQIVRDMNFLNPNDGSVLDNNDMSVTFLEGDDLDDVNTNKPTHYRKANAVFETHAAWQAKIETFNPEVFDPEISP